MPFYDSYTRDRFAEMHGRAMGVIPRNDVDPHEFSDETSFLPTLIGNFTAAVTSSIRAEFPDCRFEVLYPPDVNETALNTAVNFPSEAWTSATLDCLKTENFTYTLTRDLDASRRSIQYGAAAGFSGRQRSHLVGISDPSSAWCKEAQLAISEGTESVVLFALDQFCLIGYAVPIDQNSGRSTRMG